MVPVLYGSTTTTTLNDDDDEDEDGANLSEGDLSPLLIDERRAENDDVEETAGIVV
jgi:hypothetical protein